MLLKICGITNLDDAIQSVRHGANALGFNFFPESPRYIEPEKISQIVAALPSEVLKVAIVVVPKKKEDEKWEKLLTVLGRLPIDVLQLHGLRSESEVPKTTKRVFVATSPSKAHSFPGREIIIDISWGRGVRADWDEVRKLKSQVILSGGLTPENVEQAIRFLQPVGVDVCSGIESSPGIKDISRLKSFLDTARKAANSYGDRKRREFRQK